MTREDIIDELQKSEKMCKSLKSLLEDRLEEYEVLYESCGEFYIRTKPHRIDENKKIDDFITEEDYDILNNIYNIDLKEGISSGEYLAGISYRDDNILVIRTNDKQWMALRGRKWNYDIKEKKLQRTCMS